MEQTIYKKQTKVEDLLNIWTELAEIGDKYGAVSLGEGTPYLQPPEFLIQNLIDAIREGYNQYTSSYGHPDARKLIAEFYSPKFNRIIDPNGEILITNGANGSMDCLLQSLISDVKDEIIFIEPMFPQYIGQAKFARATLRFVPLDLKEDNKWYLDIDTLKETLNENSRVIVFNFPQNPTGKVFSSEEINEISEILENFPNCFVLCDDVYDFLTFDDHDHHIGGKLLCCTGWKIGWAIGPREIMRQAVVINDTCTYCHNVPGQIAVARSLKTAYNDSYKDDLTYVEYVKNDLKKNHDLLLEGLRDVDLPINPVPASGGYFIFVDVTGLREIIPDKYFKQEEYEDDKQTTIEKNDYGDPVPLDLAVSRWLAIEKKVVTLPGTFFYDRNSTTKSDKFIRMAFCRGEKIINQAIKNIKS